jgi:hypothetical protein
MSDKILYKNKWVSLIQKENPESGDTYTVFSEANKVIVLPYFIQENGDIFITYLLEPISSWRNKTREITCISGTIESGDEPFETAIRVLEEDAGISLKDNSKWDFAGSYFHSKSATSERFLYIVDITDSEIFKKTTDGSWFEKNTKNVISTTDSIKKQSKDLYLSYLINYLEGNVKYGTEKNKSTTTK